MPNSRSAILAWVLGAAGLAAFAWVLSRIDYEAFLHALANASGAFVALVPLAILFEQWVAAAKWRLLLAELGSTRLSRVFAANMAAFLANYVVPVAGSPIVRSWLVASCEGLRFASVLATIAVDRLVDGAAFLAFAAGVIFFIAMPQAGEGLSAGLIAAAALSVLLHVDRARDFLALLGDVRHPDRAPAQRGQVDGFVAFLDCLRFSPEPRLAMKARTAFRRELRS